MSSPIRMEALEALDAIARHGSFAAAAAALYRVPSSISYTINQLEYDLGVALFDRSGHRAVLTAAGQVVLDEGRRILMAGAELAAAARRAADDWEPELRLVVDGLIAPAELWPAIDAFSNAHPAISIRVAEEVLGGTWETLLDKRADLAIGIGNAPSGAGIQRRPFTEVAFAFCCAPSHPLAAQREPISDDERRSHCNIVVADSARHLSPRSAGLLDGQPRLTVASMYSKIDALVHGLGVGYCPRRWVQGALVAGTLVEKQLAEPRAPRTVYVLWRSGERGRALQWFIERLGES